ncbi:MAG: zinc-dependent alcohol dehydrogenase family protein [Planctomycetaceae bacterium]|nr:zinc-dependent alcohol dehydrogenase family protein [Planctomycetaceae bacterium]
MRAVRFHSHGEPSSVLQLEEVPKPVPAHGQVLVRMLTAPVNPSDLMYIRGQYTVQARCPAIPGFEGVGVVEQSGGGLRGRIFTGKRVAVLSKEAGSWGEYAVAPADQVIPLDSRLTNAQAATFFVNPATAWVMTQEVLRIPPNEWLLLSAASSALGSMIIRLGVALGFRTLCIVRRESQVAALRKIGATEVVVFDGREENEADFQAGIADIMKGRGVSFAIDPVGGLTGSAIVRSLGPNGHLLVYGTLSGQPLNFSPRALMNTGSRVEGFWLGNFMASKGLFFKLGLVRRLARLVREGTLDSPIQQVVPLCDVRDAVMLAERSGEESARGKILIQIAENAG